ncbi:MAG: trehalose-6-phosphate synthase [Deltaproteobacteria bacterium]|nr:trehalose-6-phosphate synthase [Deltaproteobacteria bacterium]
MCVVSSLHDGMSLVAKEYISASRGKDGMVVLSEFAGAAKELTDALIVNPYDNEAFAHAIHLALTMPPEERKQRMARMHQIIEENNVYRWAGDFLAEISRGKGT